MDLNIKYTLSDGRSFDDERAAKAALEELREEVERKAQEALKLAALVDIFCEAGLAGKIAKKIVPILVENADKIRLILTGLEAAAVPPKAKRGRPAKGTKGTSPKAKRGRPAKSAAPSAPAGKRPRGRPAKAKSTPSVAPAAPMGTKRPRGRPKKVVSPSEPAAPAAVVPAPAEPRGDASSPPLPPPPPPPVMADLPPDFKPVT